MVDTLEEVQKRLEEVQVPMLIIQGEHDRLCERSGAELLYEKAASQDKKLSVGLSARQARCYLVVIKP